MRVKYSNHPQLENKNRQFFKFGVNRLSLITLTRLSKFLKIGSSTDTYNNSKGKYIYHIKSQNGNIKTVNYLRVIS